MQFLGALTLGLSLLFIISKGGDRERKAGIGVSSPFPDGEDRGPEVRVAQLLLRVKCGQALWAAQPTEWGVQVLSQARADPTARHDRKQPLPGSSA